jgi:phosphotransacetylase
MSAAAARANGVESKVAGQADVLIVPSLEAGALMLRTMTGMFGALAAGVVLGAKVPIVLAGRSDTMEVRMAGCVLASLVAQIALTAETAQVHNGPTTVTGVRVAA